MHLSVYSRAIRSFWKIVVVLGVLGAAIGAALAFWTGGKVEASIQLMIAQTEFETQPQQYPFPLDTKSLANSYAALINAEAKARLVEAKQNSEPEIIEVTAVSPDGTSLVVITAVGDDDDLTLAEVQFTADNLVASQAPASTVPYELAIMGPAQLTAKSNGVTEFLRDIFGGALAGVIVGAAVALILSVSDRRIRSRDQVVAVPGVDVVVAVPERTGPEPDTLDWKPTNADSAVASALEIGFSNRAIVFTSLPDASPSKALAIATAKTFSAQGYSVSVVTVELGDTQSNSPQKVPATIELTSAEATDDTARIRFASISGTPTSGLNLRYANELIRELADQSDFVIIAAPPLDRSSTAAVFATVTKAMVITVDAGVTHLSDLAETIDYLTQFEGIAIGVAIQGVPVRGLDSDQYGPVSR